MFWFSVVSRLMMRSTDRPIAVVFSRDSSTRICRRRPPLTLTAATPGTRSSRCASVFSAMSRSWTALKSPSTARKRIGNAVESNLKTIGASASSGRRARMRSMRLRTSSAATLRLVPQAKLRRMTLDPSFDVALTCSRPATALTACSSGRVIDSSISRGPTPG